MMDTPSTETTRDRLLRQGLELVLAQGYRKTGLKQILDAVNVPKGSFYHYFASKTEFGIEMLRHYSRCLGDKLEAALASSKDPLSGLRHFFEAQMLEFAENQYTGGCLVGKLASELDQDEIFRKELASSMQAWRDAIAEPLRTAQSDGRIRTDVDARELADLLVSTWEGAVLRMKLERSTAPLRQAIDCILGDYCRPRG